MSLPWWEDKRSCKVCGISLAAHSLVGLRQCRDDVRKQEQDAEKLERALLEKELEATR